MPSSLGHSLFGLILFWAFRPASWPLSLRTFVLVACVAALADFDFIPGFIAGDPNRYHRGASHSIGLALLLSIPVYLAERRQLQAGGNRVTRWFLILYLLHIAMDYFGADLRAPFGQPLFWPLSDKHFIFSQPLFWEIQRSPDAGQFIPSLFNRHNLLAILREFTLGAVMLIVLAAARRGLRRGSGGAGGTA